MVVKDRLAEMQKASKYVKEDKVDETEMKPLKKSGMDFEDFLETAEEIATGISEVKKNVDNIKVLQHKILNEPIKSERDKHQHAYNDLLEENKRLYRKIQKLLKEEQAKIEKMEKRGSLVAKEYAELRVRKTQIQTHSTRFMEIWTEYSTGQVEFRDKAKRNLVKNIKIAGDNSLTDENIEEKIDSGDISAFSGPILQANENAKKDLERIENRHAEILKLEKSIVEIHDMFMDLHNWVTMQGELVDRIDHNIGRAVDDIESGREQLFQAQRNKIAANKKKICLISTLVIVVIIVLIIILSEFGAFSSSGSETVVKEVIRERVIITKVVNENGTVVDVNTETRPDQK